MWEHQFEELPLLLWTASRVGTSRMCERLGELRDAMAAHAAGFDAALLSAPDAGR
jgi:hypothetical protein